MSTTYIAEQYLCDTSASYSQPFTFMVDATGSLNVQLGDGTFTSDLSTTFEAFLQSNGYPNVDPFYMSTIESLVAQQVTANPSGVATGRFYIGAFCTVIPTPTPIPTATPTPTST